jgi:hypothetical protein
LAYLTIKSILSQEAELVQEAERVHEKKEPLLFPRSVKSIKSHYDQCPVPVFCKISIFGQKIAAEKKKSVGHTKENVGATKNRSVVWFGNLCCFCSSILPCAKRIFLKKIPAQLLPLSFMREQ